MLTGVEFLLPSVPLGGVGSYSAAGSICPNLCTQLFEACMAGDWARGARAAIQDDAAVAAVPRPVPVLAQGRHGDHGPPGRPDARRRCRPPRPERQAYIRSQLEELGILDTEPHGW